MTQKIGLRLLHRFSPLAEADRGSAALAYAPEPWELRQCNETGFVFLQNPPEYEALKVDFAWEKTWQEEANRRKTAEPMRYAASTAMKRFRTRVLKRNKVLAMCAEILARSTSPVINIVDIGCGAGLLVRDLIAEQPASVASRCIPHGVEISSELAKIAQIHLSAVGGKCAQNNAVDGMREFPTSHFQLIVMSSFLEHEVNPLPLLRSCHSRLADNGQIVIKVPNYNSVNRHLRGARWCGFRWPDHVNYFTPESLTSMAHRVGFEIARMNIFDRNPISDSLYAVLRRT